MNKRNIIAHVVAIVVGIIFGLWVSHCTRKPVETVKVERDTVVVYDTIPDYNPKPKDSIVTKYVTRYLPVHSTDTVDRYITMTDTVAVEVPITSKHYGGENYDAWVSGFEPSLDSIKVYRETQYITERVTISKPPNKVALFLDAGVGYTFNDKRFYPHAGGELVLNNHKRVQFAIDGGVAKAPLDDRITPYARGKVKIRLF